MADHMDAVAAVLAQIAENQKKTAEVLDKLDERLTKVEGLRIDPAKLNASTQGVTPQITVVEPRKDGPNLQEPNPDPRVPRQCWKCGQLYTGPKHC